MNPVIIVFFLHSLSIRMTTFVDGVGETNTITDAENTTYKNPSQTLSISDDLTNTTSIHVNSSQPSNISDIPGKNRSGADSSDVFSAIHQGSVSQVTYESLEYALSIFVLPVVIIMGLCGNMAALRTLLNERPRDPIIVYLISLSLTDTFSMIIHSLVWVKDVITLYNRRLGLEMYAIVFVPFALVLGVSTVRASAFITVLMSIERVVAVIFPYRVNDILLNRHPRKIMMGIYVITLLIFLPNVLRFETRVLTNEETNQTIMVILPTQISKSTMFFTYYGLAAQIVTRILPMVLVLVCNIVTIAGVRASQRTRKHLGTNQREDMSVTRLLLSISAIFLVCTAPGTVSLILTKFIADYGFLQKEHFLFYSISNISECLDTVNSAVNFIAYMFLSKRFRETFFRTWRCADRLRNRARHHGSDDVIESNRAHA